MSDLDLSIAGLRFIARLPAGLRLIERDAVYGPFLGSRVDADQPIEVTVHVTLEPAPETSGLPVLFDTGETWVAFEDNGDVLLRMRSVAGDQDYLWVVRLVGGLKPVCVRQVAIYCGRRLVESRGVDRHGAVTELTNPLHYPLDQLLMMFALPALPGVLIHAAGLARTGRGVLCAGVSGAGKTTFMNLPKPTRGLDGLSDDRVIVRRIDDHLRLFGTPWAGEGRVAANRSVELAAITFLHQADRNELRSIDSREALSQLLATTSILWFDQARMSLAMDFCEALVQRVPCYELHFRPETAAVELLDQLI